MQTSDDVSDLMLGTSKHASSELRRSPAASSPPEAGVLPPASPGPKLVGPFCQGVQSEWRPAAVFNKGLSRTENQLAEDNTRRGKKHKNQTRRDRKQKQRTEVMK